MPGTVTWSIRVVAREPKASYHSPPLAVVVRVVDHVFDVYGRFRVGFGLKGRLDHWGRSLTDVVLDVAEAEEVEGRRFGVGGW